MEASPDIGLEGVPNVLVDEGGVEPFGIEVPAAPALHIGVFRIVLIGDDGEELLVARDAADIFGRPGSGAVDAACLFRCGIEREELLDLDRVMPVVAEVVDVDEGRSRLLEVAQADLALVEGPRIALERAFLEKRNVALAQAADAELVKMIVPPVEGGLDAQVELFEVPGQWHDEAAPDLRLDLVERDADLDSVGLLEHGGEWSRPAHRRQDRRSAGDDGRRCGDDYAADGRARASAAERRR